MKILKAYDGWAFSDKRNKKGLNLWRSDKLRHFRSDKLRRWFTRQSSYGLTKSRYPALVYKILPRLLLIQLLCKNRSEVNQEDQGQESRHVVFGERLY